MLHHLQKPSLPWARSVPVLFPMSKASTEGLHPAGDRSLSPNLGAQQLRPATDRRPMMMSGCHWVPNSIDRSISDTHNRSSSVQDTAAGRNEKEDLGMILAVQREHPMIHKGENIPGECPK